MNSENTYSKFDLNSPEYRADIDGLRAIAVLSVIFFHFFPGFLHGGYIGVDIFFVISGFLISQILFKNFEVDKFSLSTFYARRIKRILPALTIVLLITMAVGWFLLLTDEYRELAKHVASGSGFISNLILWGESGYFDQQAASKPLLHLWSLGIEEQFYLLWPIVLWIAYRFKKSFSLIIVILGAASFLLNAYLVNVDLVADFYSPFARAWELLVGAFLAYLYFSRKICFVVTPRYSYFLSVVGIFFIAFSILLFEKSSKFPGWLALLPTVGTGLVIAAGSKNRINKYLLAHPMLVWVGLISYPLYLWHWPIYSYYKILNLDLSVSNDRLLKIFLIAICLVLAYLTYKFVEQPIRHRKSFKIPIYLLLTNFIVGIFGLCIFLFAQERFTKIIVEPKEAHVLFGKYPNGPTHNEYCDKRFPSFKEYSVCLLSKDSEPDILLLGDSHSQQYYSSLAGQIKNLVVMNVGEWNCLPFSSLAETLDSPCRIKLNHVLNFISTSKSIKTVIVSGYYSALASGGFQYSKDLSWRRAKELNEANSREFQMRMKEVLRSILLADKSIIFMQDIPDLNFDIKNCAVIKGSLFRRFPESGITDCRYSRSEFEEKIFPYDDLITSSLKDMASVYYFETRSIFCNSQFCDAFKNSEPLYFDSDHLSAYGAHKVTQRLLMSYPFLR